MSNLTYVYHGSSASNYDAAGERTNLNDWWFSGVHAAAVKQHRRLLTNVTADPSDALPIMFVKARPSFRHGAGSSWGRNVYSFHQKYEEISDQLRALEDQKDEVEAGAVHTAATVVEHLAKSDLAPPALSWMGGEAIVMLWILGSTKYALTITDGEIGYVVRAEGKTLRREHSIPLGDFSVQRLT